jgi:hypothetical protein
VALAFGAAAIMLATVLLPIRSDGREAHTTLAVVVHKSSPYDDLPSGTVSKILGGELWAWPDSRTVVLVQRPPETLVYQEMLRLVLHTDLSAYKRHLIQLEFQGKELPLIKTLSSDETVLKFVGNVPGAIAAVDAAALGGVVSRIKIIRVDGKFPGERGYQFQ